jgi:glutathionylspermidine synthase
VNDTGAPYRVGELLPKEAFEGIRQRALLYGCKWDAQVGDTNALANFALILQAEAWRQLASWAEQLTAEAFAAEKEILDRPALLRLLGFPDALRRALTGNDPLTPAAVRVIRFDFHLTTEGWRISEANSDVPGGFTESSYFTAQVARHYSACTIAGNPVQAWADAICGKVSDDGPVALLCAPGWMEDLQVVSYLGSELVTRGFSARLAAPPEIHWRHGRAYLRGLERPLSAMVRFFEGDQLGAWRYRAIRRPFFRGGLTPIHHPGHALITESKRFPLAWPHLFSPLPAWRALLPESRDPQNVPWEKDDSWLVKKAFSNTGDTVAFHSAPLLARWKQIARAVRRNGSAWIAQRRFSPVPLPTPIGDAFPCIGVYTVNGRAAGIYGRLTKQAIVDYRAIDVAVLIEDEVSA